MIASPRPLAPASAGPGTPGTSAGVDPAASAFAALLAGLLPLPPPSVAAPPPPSAATGPASGPGLAAIPGTSAAPTAPATPAVPLAPALPAASGRAAPQPPADLPGASGDKVPPAAVPPTAGAASAPPPPVPPQVTGIGAEPPFEPHGRAPAASLLERLPSTTSGAAAPAPVPIERALATPAGAPPVAFGAPPLVAAEAPRPAVGASGLVSLTDRAPGLPPNAIDALPQPGARVPAATPPVPLAGAELLESAPTSDAASEAAVERTESAPGRAERAASEPLGTSQRAAPPPPLVQVGVQIATAAARRVDRMIVQLEPAALGRVEVRLDFSHDNRVSALIAADRPETLEILQRDSRALERSLQDAGLRLADNALNFSLRQEHRQRQAAAGEPSGAPPEPPVGPLAQEDARAARWFLAERVLDIRI